MSDNKNTKRINNLILSALFAALITVMTAYVKFNTGINNGYLHFGDCLIYLAACLLPIPNAMLAAAVGGGLADVLAGVPVWSPFTAVIKALNALTVALIYRSKMNKKQSRLLSPVSVTASLVSGLVTVFGYLLAEGLLYSFPTALTSVPFSIIQAAGSTLLFILASAALDKIGFKNRIIK